MDFPIPENVIKVIMVLVKGGHDAYLVGGCVRDLVMGKIPKDFDVTTDATPEEMVALFEQTLTPTLSTIVERGPNAEPGLKVVYENKFGTVSVIFENEPLDSNVRQIEITPYRTETTYSDNRHPDEIKFAKTIQDDLMRRDFTMNALAYKPHPNPLPQGEGAEQITDLYGGLEDIKNKVIRTVGDANERFGEDALRMMRAIRFASQLGFAISGDTLNAISANKKLLEHVSIERIRDEFSKIISSNEPAIGIGLMKQLGILEMILPELLEGDGCHQGGAHKYDVLTHLIMACQHAADKKFSFPVRLAALFHDIGKPRTKRPASAKATAGKDGKSKPTFYGHEVVGAKMAKKIMERMKYSRAEIELVTTLVRWHMFFSDTEAITLSAVRRMIANVNKPLPNPPLQGEGTEHNNIWLLMQIRECDRVGMAKTEAPYRLRKYHAMIEEALRDPISVSQLKIDGNYLMKDLGIKPGPRMGWMLHALLEEILEDPAKNTVEILTDRVRELEQLSDAELKKLGEKGKEAKEEVEEEEVKKLHAKHGVKK